MYKIKELAKKIRNLFRVYDVVSAKSTKPGMEQISQISCMNQYKLMSVLLPADKLPSMCDAGFKVYSQFDEDGILLYIFSIIGFTNRRIVEIGAGDGKECNSANLIINHACHGLLLDGDPDNIRQAIDFFAKNASTWLMPPVCKHAWITKDNINTLIDENGFSGDVDLLSIDIDGNDYWIWKSIGVLRPRVMICETHNICPDGAAITIPYKEDFCYTSSDNYHEEFRSVSPLAMIKLSREKGYRLIGSHKYGFNLIFMRNDVGKEFFPEVDLGSISNNPYTVEAKKTRWDAVKNAPWVEV